MVIDPELESYCVDETLNGRKGTNTGIFWGDRKGLSWYCVFGAVACVRVFLPVGCKDDTGR